MVSKIALPLWFLIVNAVIFQAIWFLAILFGDSLVLLVVPCLLALHFYCLLRIYGPQVYLRNELLLVALCLLIGFFVELIKLQLGVWSAVVLNNVPPFWLMAIWAGFGITLHSSLSFLQGKIVLPAVLGLLLAPASYFAGAKLSASHELAGFQSLFIIAALWFFVMPILAYIAKQLPVQKTEGSQC